MADPDGGELHEPLIRGPWTLKSAREVYANPWIGVTEYQVITPTGGPGLYGVVHLRNLAVGCVPILEDGTTLLVGQHRFPGDYYSWELPEGGGSFDDPRGSAERELIEETGYRAAHWSTLIEMDLSNAVTDERAVGFLAWGLRAGEAKPDDTEDLKLKILPFSEALEMALSGEMRDAFSQAMLLKVEVLGRRGLLPEAVARSLGYPTAD